MLIPLPNKMHAPEVLNLNILLVILLIMQTYTGLILIKQFICNH